MAQQSTAETPSGKYITMLEITTDLQTLSGFCKHLQRTHSPHMKHQDVQISMYGVNGAIDGL